MNWSIQEELAAVMPTALSTGLFVSLFTAQQASGNFGPSGQPDGTYVDIPGLVNIPCMASPPSSLRIQSTEMKNLEEIMASSLMHVVLSGYYPQLENGISTGWRCIIDGTVWDMLGAESDSQGTLTRMEVRIASV